jgi:general secretion pathway protein G
LGGIPAYNSGATLSLEGFGINPLNPFVASKDDVSTDPTWNKFAQSNRHKPYYRFDSNRLVLDNGYPGYIDTLDIVNDKRFYAYFCSYNGIYDPDDCNFAETDDNSNALMGAFEVYNTTFASPSPNPYTDGAPIAVDASGNLDTKTSYSCRFLRRDSYQLISAGYDRKYGIGGHYTQRGGDRLPFSAPANQTVTGIPLPSNARACEADNITNFATGKLD